MDDEDCDGDTKIQFKIKMFFVSSLEGEEEAVERATQLCKRAS